MNRLFTSLIVCGALLLSAVSIVLNFQYAQSQGETVLNGWLYGLAMGGADALKCALPFLFAVAVSRRQLWSAVAIVPLFVLLTLFSMLSAIGFAAENRGGRIDSREGAAARYHIVKASHDLAVARQAEIGAHRSRNEIETTLQATLLSIPEGATASVAKLSFDCTRSAPVTRAACSTVLALRQELARAIEADRLAVDINAKLLELDRLIAAGALRDSDSQASAISRLLERFGADVKLVRSGLSWLMAIVIEAGSSLGLYLASLALRREPNVSTVPAPAPTAATFPISTPSVPTPPMPVTAWWFARLHVSPGAALTFHEAFDDYLAFTAANSQRSLDYGAFRQGFDVVAGRVSLTVIGSQIQNVRLGAA